MGGMSVFLSLLAKKDGLDKKVVSVDSFRGLLPPDPRKDNPTSPPPSTAGERSEPIPGRGAEGKQGFA
jgi:hypothetical protein